MSKICLGVIILLVVAGGMLIPATLTHGFGPTPFIAHAQPTSYSYAYELNISLEPSYLYVLNESTVLVIGSANGSSVVQVLNIKDPYNLPRVLQTYPLIGEVTDVAINGYPVERIAVGTDMGDIVLFKVSGGRIEALLHAVEGTDFMVKKLLILRAGGAYKLAVLADEEARTYKGVCTTCHVYVFDESTGGALRIGPEVGNASTYFERVFPQDIAAALRVSNGMYYYDASTFVVTWVPYQEFYRVVINVTYYNETEYVPGAGTLINVVAYNKTLDVQFHYGTNADDNGIAEVLVPVGFKANISVKDVYNRVYYWYVDPTTFPPGTTETYAYFELPKKPITFPAEVFYKTPEFQLAVVDILDVSSAPTTYNRITTLETKINPSATGLSLVRGEALGYYVLTYHDPDDGMFYLRVYDDSFKEVGMTSDYVGMKAEAEESFTFPDGKLVVSGFKEGKVKYYAYDEGTGTYKFLQELTLGGELKKMSIVPSAGSYYYIAYSTTGLHIVKAYPNQVPLLRTGTNIGYGGGVADGDVLQNLKMAVIASGSKLTVVEGLDKLVEDGKPIDIDSIKAPTLYLTVTVPPQETVNGTVVTFAYPGGVRQYVLNETGELSFPNLIPYRQYSFAIVHPEPYLTTASFTIIPTTSGRIYKNVSLVYREFTLTLNVKDNTGTELLAPYMVMVDGETVIESSKDPSVGLTLIFGNHTISVQPAKGYEAVYDGVEESVFISSDTSLDAVLNRKMYTLEVMVIDTKSETPLAPIRVTVEGYQEKIIGFGGSKATFEVPYGNYTITLKPLEGYENVYYPAKTNTSVTKPTVVSVTLQRKSYLLNISIQDTTVGKLIGKFDVYVNGSKVLSEVGEFSNVTLEYGTYEILVKPVPTADNIYKAPGAAVVQLYNDTNISFTVQRKFYLLKVIVTDDTGNPFKGAEVTFYSIDTGSVVTTLLTDDTGTTMASLYYGDYRIDVKAGGFYETSKTVSLGKNTEVSIVLAPEPLTLLFRFLPVIIVALIAIIGVVLILKLRTKILERFSQPEELF